MSQKLEAGQTYFLSPNIMGIEGDDFDQEPINNQSEEHLLLGDFPKPPSAVERTRTFLEELNIQHGFGSPLSVIEKQFNPSQAFKNLGTLIRTMEASQKESV